MSAYQAAVTIPAVKAETRALVEAEAAKRTETAINEVSSDAEKVRFMRRYCRDLGRLYDFETNKCRDARAARSIAGTSRIGAKGATVADQDAIDDTAAGKCGKGMDTSGMRPAWPGTTCNAMNRE